MKGQKCRSCGASIRFQLTKSGRWMPVDLGTDRPHWATCPHADTHRRVRKAARRNGKG